MTTNKESIEVLKFRFDGVQDWLYQIEINMIDKIHHLEETIDRLSEVLLSNKESSSPNNHDWEGHGHSSKEDNNGGLHIVSSKMAKLEFPLFLGDNTN